MARKSRYISYAKAIIRIANKKEPVKRALSSVKETKTVK